VGSARYSLVPGHSCDSWHFFRKMPPQVHRNSFRIMDMEGIASALLQTKMPRGWGGASRAAGAFGEKHIWLRVVFAPYNKCKWNAISL
jgi:hypothetical protein